MIDLTETIDRMFEAGRPSGTQLQIRIFDKSVLLPLPQLLDAASHKAGRTISEAELRIMAGQGWLPLLPGAGIDGNEEGAPVHSHSFPQPAHIGRLNIIGASPVGFNNRIQLSRVSSIATRSN